MNKKLNQKGFSLVELLAVIAILAILMVLAIPAISKIMINSKLDIYLDEVKLQTTSISKLIHSEEYFVEDENTTYYFDYKLGNDGKASSSPFAEWASCYVVVTYDGKNIHYYWTGVDKAGWRIDLKKEVSKLKRSDIYNSSYTNIVPGNTIGGRDNIVIYSEENGEIEKLASNEVTSEIAKKCFSFKELDNNTYSITNYDKSCGSVVEVPSMIDGKVVSIIDENAFRNKGLTEVYLYNGITELKNGAFQGNKTLTKVKLSASIKIIGDYAFYNDGLVYLDLPEGLEVVGQYAFAYNNLKEIHFSSTLKSVGYRAFINNQLTEVDLNSNASIGGACFSNNKMPPSSALIYKTNSDGSKDYSTLIGYGGGEKNVIIPESVNGIQLKTINSNAFSDALIESIVIPDSVTYIGASAFYNNKLKSIILPSNLKTIGSQAFRANYLTDIQIPSSVVSIGAGAFTNNCEPSGKDMIYARNSDGSINYSRIVSGSSGRASGCSNGNSTVLNIPASANGIKLKTIDSGAFCASGYSSINFPDLSETDNLTVGRNVLIHNSNSKLPSDSIWIYRISNGKYDYSVIDSYAGLRTGSSLIFPDEKNGVKLTTINASITWSSFTTITIPESVTTIVNSAFSKTNNANSNLVKIINKTGKEFDWYQLTGSNKTNPGKFITGTVSHQSGNIEITDK